MNQIADKHQATQELVEFLRVYASLLEAQLNGVREQMVTTIESIMAGISNISSAADDKKQMAEAILVRRKDGKAGSGSKQGDDATFKNASATELGFTDPSATVEERARAAKGRFKKHMESLSSVDAEMRDILLSMMGALSADDVVGQRLEHIRVAIGRLKSDLGDTIADFPGRFNIKGVRHLEQSLIDKMFHHYTMEEEKEVFRSVFGNRQVK